MRILKTHKIHPHATNSFFSFLWPRTSGVANQLSYFSSAMASSYWSNYLCCFFCSSNDFARPPSPKLQTPKSHHWGSSRPNWCINNQNNFGSKTPLSNRHLAERKNPRIHRLLELWISCRREGSTRKLRAELQVHGRSQQCLPLPDKLGDLTVQIALRPCIRVLTNVGRSLTFFHNCLFQFSNF